MFNNQNLADQVSKYFIGLKLSSFMMNNGSAIQFYAEFEGVRKEFVVSSVLTEIAAVHAARSKILILYPEIKKAETLNAQIIENQTRCLFIDLDVKCSEAKYSFEFVCVFNSVKKVFVVPKEERTSDEIVKMARFIVEGLFPNIQRIAIAKGYDEFFLNKPTKTGEKPMATINELQTSQQRIEAAQHALNDEIRKGGLLGLNTSVKLQNVVDQNGSRDVVFVDCRVSPSRIEV